MILRYYLMGFITGILTSYSIYVIVHLSMKHFYP
jgi:hypothetical protein